MLTSYSKLIGTPVLSVHVSSQIATVTACIIDPDNLKIIAFIVDGPMIDSDTGDVLDINSIREYSNLGFVIDSTDALSKRDDIVKVKKIIELDFVLVGLKVETKTGTKLGKITDLIITSDALIIQQLIVKRPAMKAFLDPELTIHRNEIIEVNDEKVVVKDEMAKDKNTAPATTSPREFVNPFRKPDFSQSDSQNLDASDTE